MSKQKTEAQKELNELRADFKKRTDELERIINGSGFDWEFKEKPYYVHSDGFISSTSKTNNQNYRENSCRVSNMKQAKKLSKVHAMNSILMQLAEHFNPKGWEPAWDDGDETKYHVIFIHNRNIAESMPVFRHQSLTIYFHKDVIDAVIEELENNREKWVHLVGWYS